MDSEVDGLQLTVYGLRPTVDHDCGPSDRGPL